MSFCHCVQTEYLFSINAISERLVLGGIVSGLACYIESDNAVLEQVG